MQEEQQNNLKKLDDLQHRNSHLENKVKEMLIVATEKDQRYERLQKQKQEIIENIRK